MLNLTPRVQADVLKNIWISSIDTMTTDTNPKPVDSNHSMPNGAAFEQHSQTASVDNSNAGPANGKPRTNLSHRSKKTNLYKTVGAESTIPVHWGLTGEYLDGQVFPPIFLDSQPRNWTQLTNINDDWQPPCSDDPLSETDLLATLHLLYEWRRLASTLTTEQKSACDAWVRYVLDSKVPQFTDRAWMFQLLAVELPLTLFAVCPTDELNEMAEAATQQMAVAIHEMLDTDGWLEARYVGKLQPLLASWTRCDRLMNAMDIAFDPEADEQLEWLVRQVIRMLRPDGSLMFAEQPFNTRIRSEFRKSLLKLSGDKLDRRLAKRCFPKPNTETRSKLLPEPGDHSEWAELAVLQSKWRNSAPKIGVKFSERRNQVEICNQKCLFQGDMTPEVSVNGRSLAVTHEFEVVCWHQDDDVDYLELETDLDNGSKLQRQFLLARDDLWLLMADVVVAHSPSRIDYQCRLPIAKGMQALSETETSEIYVKDSRIRSLIMPLGLSEWKTGDKQNVFLVVDDGLQLRQSIDGAGICAALFFDLNQDRSLQPRTWRRLTVGEQLNIVSPDQAVAFRVMIGTEQWLLYRSVASQGNRTFMGENFSQDFFVGRFDRHGEVEELLQISND